MARIFDIKITSGTSHSFYTIYYDQVDAANIATRVSTSLPATGVTYNDLTSGSGVTVSVPNSATSILLYNNSCVIDDEIILPTPTPSPTPTSSPTPTPTSSPTPSPTPSPSPTETPTPTPSPSPTNTPTPSPTTSPTPTPTPSPTPNCDFDMDINVVTPTPTPSPSPTSTPTPTPTSTPTPTPSPSPSPTETPTPTPSPTTSPTPTPTSTPTPTPSPTPNCDFDVDVTLNTRPSIIVPNFSQTENTATGNTIGNLVANDDEGGTFTWVFEDTASYPDNNSFSLTSGGVLSNAEVFNHEVKSLYTLYVKVTDNGGLTNTREFTVDIVDVNETPYGLTLSNNSQRENTSTGTTIGIFSGLDVDSNETFTYALTGTGNDNASFSLSSAGVLKNAIVFNYEVKNSYSIKVTVTDSGNNTYTDTFTISVLDVNETPTNVGISFSSIYENVVTGTTIGGLYTIDPDTSNTFTYTLVSGTGSTDNDSFDIDGTSLKSAEVFNYEVKSSYSIRVRSTDQGGLFKEKVITISILNVTVSGTVSVTNPLCHGGTGTIEVTSQTGGGSPYTYSRNGSTYQSSTTFSSVPVGSHTIYVKDTNGEIGTISTSVTQPSTITISDTHTDPTCNGDSDGTITWTVGGGTGTKTYTQNGVAITDLSQTGLDARNYTLVATDENGCTSSRTVVLTKSAITLSVSKTNTICNGLSSGEIRITQIGGGNGGPYKIKFDDGEFEDDDGTTRTISNLSAGTYTITIQDGSFCEKEFSVTITEPTQVSFTETHIDPTCWDGKDGKITITASGGNGVYQYTKDGFQWGSSNIFSGLTTGTYSIDVRDTNLCTTTSPSNVTLSTSSPNATITSTNVICNGDDDGIITVSTPTGGSGATYQVKINTTNSTQGTYVNLVGTVTYEDLSPDTYYVFIKDSDGCSRSYSKVISQNTTVVASSTGSAPSCFGDTDGSITVTGSGGTGSYTYKIGSGSYQTSNSFTSLGNGTYTLYVKDSNGCVDTTSTTLNRTQVSASIYSNQPSCNGGNDGDITLSSISGGSGATYQYKFSSGNWTNFTTPVTFGSKTAGTYTIQVRDSEQCSRSYSYILSQPTNLVASVAVTHPTCNASVDGQIVISSTGGSGTKLYSINGVNYYTSSTFTGLSIGGGTAYVKDANECVDTQSYSLSKSLPSATIVTTNPSCNKQVTGSFVVSSPSGGNGATYSVRLNTGSWTTTFPKTYSNLSATSYTIQVKDGEGCVRSYSKTITQPTAITISAVSSNPTCDGGSDGSITWSVGGGTGTKTYTQNGVAITNLSQTNLGEGTYTLIATDENGCTKSLSRTLSKSAVSATVSHSNPTCYGGTGSISVSSPSGGNGGTYSVKLGSGSYTTTFPKTYSSLSGGSHVITVKDGSGCTRTYTKTITVPTQVSFTTTLTHPSCSGDNDGEIVINASGGSGSYTYSLNNGFSYQASSTFSTLSSALYLIRVKDSANCVRTGSAQLNKTAPNATFTTSSVSCHGGSDGEITVSNPTGGNGATYSSKIGSGSYTTTFPKTYTSLSEGKSTITIKDKDGCEQSYEVTVTEPSDDTATITSFTTGANGDITVTSAGGTWNKTYRLYEDTTSPYTNSGGTLVATITGVTAANHSQTFSNLSEGYYYVVVTDDNGCVSSTSEQSTFEGDCNCIEVGVTQAKMTSGGQDLYYGNNDCADGLTYYDLSNQLAGLGDGEGNIFKFCSKSTVSHNFKYGEGGDVFDGPASGGITVTPFDNPCTTDSDCSKSIFNPE